MNERETIEQGHVVKLKGLEKLLNQIPEGVVALDNELRYIFVNQGAAQFVGLEPNDMIGRKFADVFKDSLSTHWLHQMQRCLDSQVTRTIEGQYGPMQRYFSAQMSPTADGLVTVFTDTTQKHEVDAERRKTQKLKEQADRAKAMATLSSGLAHELNNLVAIVRGSLELIKLDLDGSESAMRSVDRAMKATYRAAEIIQSLRSYVKDAKPFEKAQFADLGMVAHDIATTLRHSLPPELEFSYDIPVLAIPVCVETEPLSQAIVNLILNAKDAVLEDKKSASQIIALRVGRIANALTQRHSGTTHEFAFITVEDNGPGIRPEILDKIFEPFFTTKQVGRGTGLGLSEVYGFAKRSNGFLEVKSMIDVGSTFTLFLPLCEGRK